MYTLETVPRLCCGQCKYFNIKADLEGEESPCKRIDHKKVQFYKPPFAVYTCGENHLPCCDFSPKHPDWPDWKDFTCMNDVWPLFVKEWRPNLPKFVSFHVQKNYDVVYLVPFDLFYNGRMITGGVLKADYKRYTVRDRVDHGVQLYKVETKKIGGVIIDSGLIVLAMSKTENVDF